MTDSWIHAWSQNMSILKMTTLTEAWWLFSIYLHSCCSHLEHRTSVKRFVSFQFLNPTQSVGLLGRWISPSQGCYLRRTTQTQNKCRHIHALSGIQTHDPSVRAGEDISCLRSRGHCDRQSLVTVNRTGYLIATRPLWSTKLGDSEPDRLLNCHSS
jgi:hypothetical protein